MKKLKVLVFEYITGGGLNKLELPVSLVQEGTMMLQALVNDLSKIALVECIIMLDYRLVSDWVEPNSQYCTINPEQNYEEEFIRLLAKSDAAWPIAPETGGVLQTLCRWVERSGKRLLTSPAYAVAMVGDKWLMYDCLLKHSVPVVSTQKLADFSYSTGAWMVKPIDGVGCSDSYLIENQADFEKITGLMDQDNYIIQPHIIGKKLSLSCLFKEGIGWLLSANLQQFRIRNQQYQLTDITVNFTTQTNKFLPLVKAVASAIPDLWGYAGIDLIETSEATLVLEINPRLTTSYAGIYEALGINTAKSVLALLEGDPDLTFSNRQPVQLVLTAKGGHVD